MAKRPKSVKTVRRSFTIWTDGGCKPNPGVGGWGALIRDAAGKESELSGGRHTTTNNRMELTAAVVALETVGDVDEKTDLIVYTDSTYVQNGVTRWYRNWVRNNWVTQMGAPVANSELWRRLLEATKRHRIQWRWVKGHSGVPENERVDQLATVARERVAAMPEDTLDYTFF